MYIIHNWDKVCLNEHSQVREIHGIFKARKYENGKKCLDNEGFRK